MAILFSGTEESGTQNHTIRCFEIDANSISIIIDSDGPDFSFINLDRQTAIRLAKELRRQIALLED